MTSRLDQVRAVALTECRAGGKKRKKKNRAGLIRLQLDLFQISDFSQLVPSAVPNPSPSIPLPAATPSPAHSSLTVNTLSLAAAPASEIQSTSTSRQRERDKDDPDVVFRRKRNTIAARKYRQKKVDRIEELEKALEETIKERDELKLRLARQEAETEALKAVMRLGKGG
ncbi:hypothetical protein SODALDRAFT_331458 [Sodiomyces alkalinus F11]|uniref:BZIP domain-containing protein n=1 Tax=Sodiomyces alkalinus (strain CBS 110278 / VKM F-3762 / F11) TaxID=1314773 RepID=A0A3N2Q4V1_SODAK|nr:hypothetical protein SODALDRAFT_331458 [Sodiomyces alkalinus F11]ROT41688.1 hypothetical protein SODALDRAFT_331458 [Sodiomyces alkalinus F11]